MCELTFASVLKNALSGAETCAILKSNQTLFNGFYMLLQPFTCLSRHTYAVISSIWTGISEQPMSGNCNMWPFWVESWETLHSGNMICAAIQHNYFLGPACRLQNPMEDRRTKLRRTMATGWSFWLWVKRCLSESTLGKWFLEFNFQFKPFNCNSMVTTIQWSLGPCGSDARVLQVLLRMKAQFWFIRGLKIGWLNQLDSIFHSLRFHLVRAMWQQKWNPKWNFNFHGWIPNSCSQVWFWHKPISHLNQPPPFVQWLMAICGAASSLWWSGCVWGATVEGWTWASVSSSLAKGWKRIDFISKVVGVMLRHQKKLSKEAKKNLRWQFRQRFPTANWAAFDSKAG